MNRTVFSAIAVTAALLIGAVAAPVLAHRGPPPPPHVGAPNPSQGKADAIATGQQLYEANCLGCHGANGGAGEIGPALVNSTGPDTLRSPARLFDAIKNGVLGTSMPPWSAKFSDDDTWRIVAYISSLRGTAIDAPSPGDMAHGEQVFWGKGQCGTCHMIRGKGGLSGPELSNIAGFRKTQSIVNALTKPYHRVYPPGGAHLLELPPRGDWHPVAVTTQDGRIIKGVLLNQDPHGLQMMGDDQQLHLFVREKLRSVTVDPASRMPTDYDKRLTPEELKDLLACPTRLGRHTTQTVSAAPAVDR